MIAVYKYVVHSKNIMFLRYILFAHRNDYCIHVLLLRKTEVASPEKLSAHNQSRFRLQQYDSILAPDSIFYSELHRYVVFCSIIPCTYGVALRIQSVSDEYLVIPTGAFVSGVYRRLCVPPSCYAIDNTFFISPLQDS